MRVWLGIGLALVSAVWAFVAWASLFWVFLADRDDYTLANTATVMGAYALLPITLIVSWSLVLQRRLPTSRQVLRGALGCGGLLVIGAIVLAIAIGIGWLFDNTWLGPLRTGG